MLSIFDGNDCLNRRQLLQIGGLGMSGIAASVVKRPPKKEESDEYDGNLMLSDDEKPIKEPSPKVESLVRQPTTIQRLPTEIRAPPQLVSKRKCRI